MSKNAIPFSELGKYNDSNSFVWTALTFSAKDKPEIEKWLKEIKFLPADASITAMKKISGNVKGSKGRSDVLFLTTETTFHPLVRLQVDGLKWTSDFINNYGRDYGVLPPVESDEEDDAD